VKHCLIFRTEQNKVIPYLIHEKLFLECYLKFKPVYTDSVSVFREQEDFCPRCVSFVMDKGGLQREATYLYLILSGETYELYLF